MKSKIIIISMVLIGFVLAVTGNLWAQRERGGDRPMDRGGNFLREKKPSVPEFNRERGRHFQKWDRPAVHKFDPDQGRPYHPRRYHHPYRPVHRIKPKFHQWHRYRTPHRFGRRFHYWRHRPIYRHDHPRPFKWRHRHSVVQEINNYYGSTESHAGPEDEIHASASVSDSGFSVSVGVSQTS